MHIFTPDTKCDFIGCDVPNISVEKFASSVCHAIRTQFAEREHVSRLFEWVIDTQKTVTISRPFVYAAPEYGKLLLRVEDVDSHGDAIAQRRAAGVPCDKLKSFCRMTVRNHRNVVERRHFVFSVVHQLQFNGV